MSNERFIIRWCVVCLVSFSVAMRIVSQEYIMRDNFAIVLRFQSL